MVGDGFLVVIDPGPNRTNSYHNLVLQAVYQYLPQTEGLSRVLLGFGFCICCTQTFPPNILPRRSAGFLRWGRRSGLLTTGIVFQKSLLVSLLQEFLVLEQFLPQIFLPSLIPTRKVWIKRTLL